MVAACGGADEVGGFFLWGRARRPSLPSLHLIKVFMTVLLL